MRIQRFPALVLAVAATACDSIARRNQPPERTSIVPIDTADANSTFLPLGDTETRPLREAVAALERGDVAGFVANMADTVVVVAPDGTEMKGRQQLYDYWTTRFKTDLKEVAYARSSYLGLNAFRPGAPAIPGKYLMVWSTVTATYQDGHSATFPAHLAVHLDAAGRFDGLFTYFDMEPDPGR
ncbi:MAG: hypothetical protein KJT01_08165 [Gemmatimonadetes bacterium]|nr:hypothetical protein [Gemmatimonadota bacterium]